MARALFMPARPEAAGKKITLRKEPGITTPSIPRKMTEVACLDVGEFFVS